jgi:O-antigen/teichoic acid export membrane protein
MAKGAFWTILFRFVTRGIGLISTVVLARLLVPADFGLVAMAMTIIATFDLMSSFSLDVVLIQNSTATRDHYDTAWTFNVISAALQAIILLLIAPLVAHFYQDARLTLVIQLLALGVLMQGFENIGILAFRKELEFHKDFKFQVLKKFSSFVVTMALALWLRNYWALLGGMLVGSFVGVILSYWVHHYRPRFSLAERKDLFHFSKWLFINNLLFFLNNQSANFILGRIAGPQSLGLYTISYEISNLPSTDLVAPINRAIFPGYSKMAHDLGTLRQGFLNVFSAIAIVALPVCTGIVLVAEPLVHVMLGEKWLDTIPLIQVLSVAGLTQALQTNKGSVYLALGKPKILTLLAAVHVSTLIPALVFGAATNGVIGAAIAAAVLMVFLMPVNFLVLFRVIGLPLILFVNVLWRPLVSTIFMITVLRLTIPFGVSSDDLGTNISILIRESLLGCFAYSGAVFFLWKLSGKQPGIESFAVDYLLRRFKLVQK